MELKICHLYPDILNLYGDRGNILCMKKRLEDRGISVSVTGVSIDEPLKASEFDLFFIGGGQDFEQEVLLRDLKGEKTAQIRSAVADGKTFLAICGGYQMLGHYYKTWDGSYCDFTGAVDFYTEGGKNRMIGNYLFSLNDLPGENVVGFENHSGMTFLGGDIAPLGTVLTGYGNNGKDHTEGVRFNHVFGTYSHGCVLPKNPGFCDWILTTALTEKYGSCVLEPLEDILENRAHSYMENRLKSKA